MTEQEFLKYIQTQCRSRGVQLIASENDSVYQYSLKEGSFFNSSYPFDSQNTQVAFSAPIKLLATDVQVPSTKKSVFALAFGRPDVSYVVSQALFTYTSMQFALDKTGPVASVTDMQMLSKWLESESYNPLNEHTFISSVKEGSTRGRKSKKDNSLKEQVLALTGNSIESVINRLIYNQAQVSAACADRVEEFFLPISKSKFIKGLNAQLCFYHWVAENRAWWVKAPDECENVMNCMSDVIHADPFIYLQKPSTEVLKAFDKDFKINRPSKKI